MIIDFHTHFLPRAFPAQPAGIDEPAWPRMEATGDTTAKMYVGAREFRSFDDQYWNAERRIATLDRTGVDVQVMSPLPEILSYWLDPKAAEIITDAVNAYAAEMVAQAPKRLTALGVAALQNLPAAVRQLETMRAAGLAGVLVGSNVNGKSVASPEFEPFFAKAEELGLVVFVHGVRPAGVERMVGPALMGAVMGIPHENAMAIASFMMADVLGRFPGLKLVFSHGGGTVGSVIDRMTHVWEKFPAMRETLKTPPAEYARGFHYDTAVFSPDYLGYLVKRFGADRILAGSDGPTEIGQTDLAAFVADADVTGTARNDILGGNAARLLASAGKPALAATAA
ncbi:MAG: amidohydrolase family protein [Aromatoleum sp.]|jgi:aminocarboxymuconate-semialdehyde decarboxylase|uniref:amidohydrolase family protein n=1 Tax=Aromatoleum sp. TaxID=2307007 RepID=UPI0028950EC2|nr:amidohydrolase family protein [Aromatoleum sp.]MDT3671257.1 amidohydrolase family protein [Aromatoleum sp.]